MLCLAYICKHKQTNKQILKVMATHKVIYSGNSTKFRNFEVEVTANSEREAVEYVTRDRQAGNIIEEGFSTETDVREAIAAYESEDLNNGTFEPNFYEACKKLTNGEIISID